MVDLVVGLGETGKSIIKLLKLRGFNVQGWDITKPTDLKSHYNFIHICFPYDELFNQHVKNWKKYGKVVIHSTVKPGTSNLLGTIYSPIRGVHTRMFDDLKRYVKYYSGEQDLEFEKRFEKIKNVPNSTILEQTKIIVDTTYYGYLIAFRKIVDKNYSVYWDFADEINEILKNRPVMYNDKKPIGGHHIMENLNLLDKDQSSMITEVIRYCNRI